MVIMGERGPAFPDPRAADVLARAAVGRSGGDAIQAMSKAYRQWALQHPGRYEAAQWAPAPGDEDLADQAMPLGPSHLGAVIP